MRGYNRIPSRHGRIMERRIEWRLGKIRCFDVDAVTLKDGQLLASHTSRFSKSVEGAETAKAEDYTIAEAREAGADEDAFPMIDAMICYYALMIRSGEAATTTIGSFYDSSHDGTDNNNIPGLAGPVLNINLKGPNLNGGRLDDLVYTAIKLGIGGNIAISVTAPSEEGVREIRLGLGVDIRQHLGESHEESVRLGLVLRDRVALDWGVRHTIEPMVRNNKAIRLIVTSKYFNDGWFRDVAAASGNNSLPVVTWTIDYEEGLIRAIKRGVSAVISNRPIEMNKILYDLKNGCKERDDVGLLDIQ